MIEASSFVVFGLCLSYLLVVNGMTPASIHPHHRDKNENTTACKKRLFTDLSGQIASPGYPVRYPSNLICTYEIKVAQGFRIELRWKDFEIDGYMPRCDEAESDHVDIYTGCNSDIRYLTRFCSKNSAMPHPVYSVDSCLSIKLVTKPTVLAKTSKGFLAHYKAINSTELMMKQNCNRTLTAESGILHSTFWPHTYRNATYDSCSWHIKADALRVVKFSIMDIDTRTQYHDENQCYSNNPYMREYDVVSIKGVGSAYASNVSLIKFFGHCMPFSYQTSFSELFVHWKTFNSYYYDRSKRGFIIGYIAYRPVSGRALALWQIGLLVFAAILACFSFWFFSCGCRCRKKRHEYTRLRNAIEDHLHDNIGNQVTARQATDSVPTERDHQLNSNHHLRACNGNSTERGPNVLVRFPGYDEGSESSVHSLLTNDTVPSADFAVISSRINGDPNAGLDDPSDHSAVLAPDRVPPFVLAFQTEDDSNSVDQSCNCAANEDAHEGILIDLEPSAPTAEEAPPPDYNAIFDGLQTLVTVSDQIATSKFSQ